MLTATQNNAAAAIVNSMVSTQQARAAQSAAATTTTSSSGTGSNITGSDFLTLLVSELKNQDPTQPTDPNAYVQQLVGVNSLQQLIDINQGLNTLEGGSSSSSTANVSAAQTI